VDKRHHLFILFLTLTVSTFYLYAVLYNPKLYVLGTYEDLYGEWLQAYSFLAASLFSLLIVLNRQAEQSFRLFFILLFVAGLYVFLEEISWGQRLIGFESPEFFKKHNYQKEANLHNLLTGPVSVWTKDFLEYFIATGLICYGLIFPLLVHWRIGFGNFLVRMQMAPPPLSLAPAFVAAAVLEVEPYSFNEAEVAELLVALSMAIVAFIYWQKSSIKVFRPIGLFLMVIIIAVASYGTTERLLSSDKQRAKIEKRLKNGYERYAKRYARQNYPPGITAVLLAFNELEPNNTVILRKIAKNYLRIGDTEKSQQYLNLALNEGLKRFKDDPLNVATNVSLAKTYRQLSRPVETKLYGKQAYAISKKMLQRHPKDAYWAYWMAKSCEQINRQKKALYYYRRASKLAPGHSRYRRAYYKKRQLMGKVNETK
jgi:hypothetical protein